MRTEIIVDNIKCGGCATTVKNKVESITALNEINVEVESGKVAFSCKDEEQKEAVISSLKKWGYPLKGTSTKIENAKSFVSCMIGRIDNLN